MGKAIVCLTLSILLGVVPYFLVHHIIMRIMEGGGADTPYIAGMAAAVFVCLALKTTANSMGLDASHHLAYDTLMGMRGRVADKLLRMPMGAVTRHGPGNLKKNFVENIEDMELILAHAMPEGISNIISFLVVIAALFLADWRMALLSMGVLPIGLFAVWRMVSDGMTRMGPLLPGVQGDERKHHRVHFRDGGHQGVRADRLLLP